MACLKQDGKSPVDRDKLMIFVIVGARTGRHFFNRKVGSGSKSHCLSGRRLIMPDISAIVVGRKEPNTGGTMAGAGK
jgi:hypothetical protein